MEWINDCLYFPPTWGTWYHGQVEDRILDFLTIFTELLHSRHKAGRFFSLCSLSYLIYKPYKVGILIVIIIISYFTDEETELSKV